MNMNKQAIGKFIIVKDLKFSDFFKNEKGEINLYDTFHEASLVCGMYELEDVIIMEIKHIHEEGR